MSSGDDARCMKHGGGQQCIHPGCRSAAQSGHLQCRLHGGGQEQCGRPCTFPECTSKQYAGNLCKMHSMILQSAIEPVHPAEEPLTSVAPTAARNATARHGQHEIDDLATIEGDTQGEGTASAETGRGGKLISRLPRASESVADLSQASEAENGWQVEPQPDMDGRLGEPQPDMDASGRPQQEIDNKDGASGPRGRVDDVDSSSRAQQVTTQLEVGWTRPQQGAEEQTHGPLDATSESAESQEKTVTATPAGVRQEKTVAVTPAVYTASEEEVDAAATAVDIEIQRVKKQKEWRRPSRPSMAQQFCADLFGLL